MAAPAVNPLLRRAVITIASALVAATSLSCTDALLGRRRVAHIVLEPRFSERDAAIYRSLATFGLTVTSMTVVLLRPNTTDTVAQSTVTVDEGQDSIVVALEAEIRGTEERLVANLEMRSGGVLVFTGSVPVIARVGAQVANAAPVLVPVWVGPGSNATRIVISPRDQVLPVSGRLVFTATAFDASGQPVTDPEFVARWRWRVNDATLASLPLAGGELVPAGKAGTAIVTVFTPNLLVDTVRITLVTQLPLATVKFARQVEVLDRGTTFTEPVAALDPNNAPVPNVSFTYVSRSPDVATVSPSGAITGVAKGQAVIVVAGQQQGASTSVQDSLLAVVAEPGAPALLTSIDKFELPRSTSVTAAVYMDMRASNKKLGSTTVDVTWNPAQLQFQSVANGASGVTPTVNASLAPTGKLTLAMADVAGFAGKVELLRITFTTSSVSSSGQLALTASEITTADFVDFLGALVQVTHPLFVR